MGKVKEINIQKVMTKQNKQSLLIDELKKKDQENCLMLDRLHGMANVLEKALIMYAEPDAWVEVTKTDEDGTKEKMWVNKEGAAHAKTALDLVKGM